MKKIYPQVWKAATYTVTRMKGFHPQACKSATCTIIQAITGILLLCLQHPVYATEVEQKAKVEPLGTPDNPLIVSLLPERVPKAKSIEGADKDKVDDLPLPEFLKLSRQQLSFKLVQSESYSKSVGDFCRGDTHLAVLSMVTYGELKKRCNIEELLAIEILEGQSVYHSGLFTHRKHFRRNNRVLSFHMLANKTVAFGSRYSTTAFHYPLKLLLDLELLLPDDLSEIYITGSHSAAIEKLAREEVEIAAASFQSWKAAIDDGTIDPMQFMPLVKSGSIPLPPLVMNRNLPDKIKEQIRRAFKEAHTHQDGGLLMGLRNRKITRYDIEIVTKGDYLDSLSDFDSIELDLIESVLSKAQINEVD